MNSAEKKARASNGKVVLRPCQCLSDYQDGMNGRSVRVHTVGTRKLTCTVCGNEKVRPLETADGATGKR